VYGDTTVTTPFTVATLVGSTHSLKALTPQGKYQFAGWSDGGDALRYVTVGASSVTYTANFTSPADAYKPVTPNRILDTRTDGPASGYPGGKPAPDSTVSLLVSGRGGVPASGAGSVVLSI